MSPLSPATAEAQYGNTSGKELARKSAGIAHSKSSKPVELVSQLVGALSPVNHKGLYQGCKQTSSLSPTYSFHKFFFSNHNSIMSIISVHKPRKTITHDYFEAYLYSAGTQRGNLHQLSATMSRVTCFILRAHTGTGVSHCPTHAKLGRGLEKCR